MYVTVFGAVFEDTHRMEIAQRIFVSSFSDEDQY